MRLGQILAAGAMSVVLTPVLGAVAGTTAYAIDAGVSIQGAPKTLGVGGDAFEFSVRTTGAPEGARLAFAATPKAASFFDEDALTVEYLAGTVWTKVDLSSTAGIPVSGDVQKLRIAYANLFDVEPAAAGAEDQAARITERLRAGERLRNDSAAADRKPAAVPDPIEADFCAFTDPGFGLSATLRQQGTVLAEDVAPIKLGFAGIRLDGMAARYVAGQPPLPFTLTICNNTDSTFSQVAPWLLLGRGGLDDEATAGKLAATDVVLEIRDAGSGQWVGLPVEQVDEVALTAGEPDTLAPHTRAAEQFRLGFRNGTAPGNAAIVAFLFAGPDAEKLLALDAAEFLIAGADAGQGRPLPELPDTGGQAGLAGLGAGLLLAGAGAMYLGKRRAA